MLILLSPAKTFAKTPSLSLNKPMFFKDSLCLQDKLKKLSLDDIQTSMHLSTKHSKTVYDDYQHLGETHFKAIEAYHGQVYKSLDYPSLNALEKIYIDKHVLIVSGLYGLVRPLDGISFYRLEMQDKTITNLYDYWPPIFSSYIKKHAFKDIIVSLCSLEYERVFDGHQIITIDFIANQKIHSMALKSLRGLFVKWMAINHIETLEDLKKIDVDGFFYDKDQSTQHRFIFRKD